jgi:glycosyltransferase involved in cell wall biosynthesis
VTTSGHRLPPEPRPATRARWPRGAPPGPPLPAKGPGGKPWPRISIVSPSFNQGAFLEETILSVMHQGYPNVEHLVMDGGSTDETAQVLERHRHHLAACCSEPDDGQSHAINKGMARATGEILTWLNSDDALAPGALAAVALAFRDPEVDMVAGICELFRDGELIHRHLTACPDGPLSLDDLLDLEGCWHPGQFFYQPEVFFRREIWERAGGHVDSSLHYSMDYELWIRMARCGARLHVIGRPLARYRVHEAQKTAAPERYRPELEQVAARYRAPIAAPSADIARNGRPVSPPVPRSPLRIAMVNDVGFRYGAGIGHGRFARAIAMGGHSVFPLAAWDGNLSADQASEPIAAKLEDRLLALGPDLVVVGNVHGARLDPGLLKRLASRWPTIFVQHDCWLLTGRCAYPGSCSKYLSPGGCDRSCPTPTEYPPLDPGRIAEAWAAKRELRDPGSGLSLAANSRWMAEEIQRVDAAMGLGPRDVPVLRYGLPLDVFKPRDPTMCRELLGLPQDRFIVLFSATGLSDPRKGLAHLLAAVERAGMADALLVGMGWVPPEEKARLPGVHFTGYVEDARTRALVYAAADVMVAPSLHEAFGQVLIEAAACGTPSVAYAVGGIPEALVDGITGLLVREVDPAGLARALKALYDDPVLRTSLGTLARIHVENEYSTEHAYRCLFHAFQGALARRSEALPPKLSLLPEAPFPETEYVIPPAHGAQQGDAAHSPGQAAPVQVAALAEPLGIERHVHQYFVDRLNRLRARRLPWYLSPAAWHARIDRQLLRRELSRGRDRTGGRYG